MAEKKSTLAELAARARKGAKVRGGTEISKGERSDETIHQDETGGAVGSRERIKLPEPVASPTPAAPSKLALAAAKAAKKGKK